MFLVTSGIGYWYVRTFNRIRRSAKKVKVKVGCKNHMLTSHLPLVLVIGYWYVRTARGAPPGRNKLL